MYIVLPGQLIQFHFRSAPPPTQPNFGNDFRKPVWFDDCETDDELYDSKKKVFGFQIFTNPLEMQKHFEQQMEQVLKSLEQFENGQLITYFLLLPSTNSAPK